jgi:hypothetical protein
MVFSLQKHPVVVETIVMLSAVWNVRFSLRRNYDWQKPCLDIDVLDSWWQTMTDADRRQAGSQVRFLAVGEQMRVRIRLFVGT